MALQVPGDDRDVLGLSPRDPPARVHDKSEWMNSRFGKAVRHRGSSPPSTTPDSSAPHQDRWAFRRRPYGSVPDRRQVVSNPDADIAARFVHTAASTGRVQQVLSGKARKEGQALPDVRGMNLMPLVGGHECCASEPFRSTSRREAGTTEASSNCSCRCSSIPSSATSRVSRHYTLRIVATQGFAIGRLAAEPVLFDDPSIPFNVDRTDIVEHPSAASDEHQEPPSTVVILGMDPQVFCQVTDALSEERNLDFGRAGVRLMDLVPLDNGGLGIRSFGSTQTLVILALLDWRRVRFRGDGMICHERLGVSRGGA